MYYKINLRKIYSFLGGRYMIYLDYAASTPVNSEVLDLFYDVTKKILC